MREPYKNRWTILGSLVALGAAGAATLGVVTYFAVRDDQLAEQSAVSRPADSIVSRLIDQRQLDFEPATGQPDISAPSALDPSVVEQSVSPNVEDAAASLFAARSLAIVPENWPRARMKYIIGATAMVHEAQSDLEFQARVDTGARTCSLHVEQYEIRDAADAMEENIGKEIRFKVTNHEGASQWIESIVDCCARVRTSDHIEERYKVPVSFRWNDFERMVLVTLNNRAKMTYPLLLGRNFLQSDFVVDVALDGDR